MTSEPKRKLAAIMFTDMVGYTAMMQKDEDKARELIERHRAHMKPFVEKHDGEIIQFVGDGTFCRFDSAIEAVRSALEIQKVLEMEPEINLRIGIHVGDVVIKGDEVYGDGVNIASRLEPMAEPGGICVSQEVYRQIKSHPEISAESLGKVSLKNVEEEMEVYSLFKIEEPASAAAEKEEPPATKEPVVEELLEKKISKSKMVRYSSVAAAVLLVWLALKYFPGNSGVQDVTADENSVAVLFIENISNPDDPQNLTRMIRELLITDLSQTQSLRVVGSQRLYDISKKYKGDGSQPITRENASEIAREALVRWMLTGSLSQFGDKLVLTTQIEGVYDGKVLNAQRAEGTDLFAVVDALGDEIRAHLGVTASAEDVSIPISDVTTNSEEAYRFYIEGLEKYYNFEHIESEELLSSAVEIDSTFSQALFRLAQVQSWNENLPPFARTRNTLSKLKRHSDGLSRADLMLIKGIEASIDLNWAELELINKEILVENRDHKEAHYQLGEAYYHNPDRDNLLALAEFETTLELDPDFKLAYLHIFDIYGAEDMDDEGILMANEFVERNPDNALGYNALGQFYGSKFDDGYSGPEEAIKQLQKSIALSPEEYRYQRNLAGLYYNLGQFKKAEVLYNSILQDATEVEDVVVSKIVMAAINYELGNRSKAMSYLSEILEDEDSGILRFVGKQIEGMFLVREGKINAGLSLLEEALDMSEIDGIRNSVLYEIQQVLYKFKKYERSNQIVDKKIEIMDSDEDLISAYLIKGRNYIGMGDLSNAEKMLQDSKELIAISNRRLRNERLVKFLEAELHFAKGNYEAANRELFRLRPNDQLELKSRIQLALGEYEKALEYADKLQERHYNARYIRLPFSIYQKGQIYEKMGNATEARKSYEALIELWKDGDKDNPILIDAVKRLESLMQES
ncbi:tetratricopeptide repeat protein [Candidatus Marinimicrobia bacterium MT.SAG.4]|nr:tetratricopeptide repeat protein [Candidatus Marinimicrobia bacterium MT.SAG.4]